VKGKGEERGRVGERKRGRGKESEKGKKGREIEADTNEGMEGGEKKMTKGGRED